LGDNSARVVWWQWRNAERERVLQNICFDFILMNSKEEKGKEGMSYDATMRRMAKAIQF